MGVISKSLNPVSHWRVLTPVRQRPWFWSTLLEHRSDSNKLTFVCVLGHPVFVSNSADNYQNLDSAFLRKDIVGLWIP